MLPVGLAVLVEGIAFGTCARAQGLEPAAALVMWATSFSGSAQFAAVSLVGGGGGVLAATLAALFLNARSVAMGISRRP